MNSTLIEFNFPQNVFIQQDYVKVLLRFGEEKYFLANDRVFVYGAIVLHKLRPLFVYTNATGTR